MIMDYGSHHEKNDKRKLEAEIKLLKEKLAAQRKSATGVLRTAI